MAIEIACRECNRRLRVADDFLGKLVRCPACGTTFTATAGEPPPSPAGPSRGEEEAPGAPPRHSVRAEEDDIGRAPPRSSYRDRDRDRDRDDDLGPAPRRSRRDADWEDDDYSYRDRRSAVRSQVSGPAAALQVVGILAIALSVLSLGLNLAVAAGAFPQPASPLMPPPRDEAERIGNLVGGICGALFGMLWGGLIIAGASKMKKLESFGLAMTASIVAMLPCNGCCLLGLPFGIWALVVLNRPEVKDAFR
jgi:predicted Zn finger-like uncharacterized protein